MSTLRGDCRNPPPAVVLGFSSDGDITILPALNPRRHRAEIETLVQRYEKACSALPPPQQAIATAEQRISDLRFYLSAAQITRINKARDDLNAWRQAHGEAVHIAQGLAPDPGMNDSYWLPDTDDC